MKIDVDIWQAEIIDSEKQLPSVNVNSMKWTRINNNNSGNVKKKVEWFKYNII